MPVVLAAAAALGLAVGSFLNVVAYRVPRHESLVRPGSHCPNCGHAVRARHNVPVAGWLLLRGRCADCAEPIGLRYPLVELGTAALFVAVAVTVLRLGLAPALPVYLIFAAAFAVATTTRLAQRVHHPAPAATTSTGRQRR